MRALTIGLHESAQEPRKTNDPRKWLPPETAVEQLGELLQLQVLYLETAGCHHARLPPFATRSCFMKNSSCEIEFSFGPDARFNSLNDLPVVPKMTTKKRVQNTTPQQGARRKRQLTCCQHQKVLVKLQIANTYC